MSKAHEIGAPCAPTKVKIGDRELFACGSVSGPEDTDPSVEVFTDQICKACGHVPCPCCGDYCDVFVSDDEDDDDSPGGMCECCPSCSYDAPPQFFTRDGLPWGEPFEPHEPPAGVDLVPRAGEIVLTCEHEADLHWFKMLDGATFERPDGSGGVATWRAVCGPCLATANGEVRRVPVFGDFTLEHDVEMREPEIEA